MPHLLLDGTPGCYASTPSSTAFDETAIIDMRADVALDDWAPWQTLVGRYGSSTNNRAWVLQSNNGDTKLAATFYNAAQTAELLTSTAATGATAGERLQVRALLNATAQTCDFYTRDPALGLALSSDTSWSALGAQVATTLSDIQAPPSGAEIAVGAKDNGGVSQRATGKFYAAYVRKGGATAIFDADFADTTTWVYS